MLPTQCQSASNVGSDAISMISGRSDDTGFMQGRVSPTVHLPFDMFKFVELFLGLAIRPPQSYG